MEYMWIAHLAVEDHSKLILEQLGEQGKLIAFDQDADAWRNKPEDKRLIPVTENFRYLKRFLRLHGAPLVDGILADLGVSSYQFDTGERGFSTRFDGPLDMRMDNRSELTAAIVLQTYSEAKLHLMFEQYGEVRNAKQLAKYIAMQRPKAAITSYSRFESLYQSGNQRKPSTLFGANVSSLKNRSK